MDRRTFIQSSAVATATAVSATAVGAKELPTPAVKRQADPLHVALGSQFRAGFLRDRAERLILRLNEVSDGRLRLAIADERSGRDDPKAGDERIEAEAYFTSEAEFVDETPELAFFSGLPGGLGLAPENFHIWLSAGAGQQFWDDLSAAHGYKSLAVGHSGRQSGWWSDIAIEHLGNLQNRPILTSGLARAVAGAVGMLPLQNGIAARNPIVEPLMGKTAYVAYCSLIPKYSEPSPTRFYFRRGLMHQGVVLSLRVSLARWERLAPSDRALLTAVANEHFAQAVAEHDAHDSEVAPHLFAARGVRQYNLPEDVTRAIVECSADLVRDISAGCPEARPLHDSFMNYRRVVAAQKEPFSMEATV